LAGAGRSDLLGKLQAERGLPAFDEGLLPTLDKHEAFFAAVRAGQDCIASEIAFFMAGNRAWLMSALPPGTQVQWIFYENDEAAAENNVRKTREEPRLSQNLDQNRQTLARFANGTYTFPESAEIRAVFRVP
jgi:hypothetical protein